MTMAYPELSRIVRFITMGAKSFGFVRYPRLVKPCDACRLLHSFAEVVRGSVLRASLII